MFENLADPQMRLLTISDELFSFGALFAKFRMVFPGACGTMGHRSLTFYHLSTFKKLLSYLTGLEGKRYSLPPRLHRRLAFMEK